MENNLTQEEPVNELVLLLKENNISEEMALQVSPAFKELFDQAVEWNKKAKEYLSDPNLSEEEKAKEARKARLALVKVRTGIEKKRKVLNEDDQQKISYRNSAAKIVTNLVTPTEALLEEVEKKQEREEQEKKDKIKNERLEKISFYNVDCTFFDLANMPEEAFQTLLENSRLAHEKKLDDQRKIEEKEALDLRFNQRLVSLTNIGFRFRDTFFEHDFLNSIHSDGIYLFDENKFQDFYTECKTKFENQQKEEEEKKKAEENRLKSEKEAAERKALLLQQEQKEREEKHKTAVLRQQKLASINVNSEYEFCSNLTEEDFENFFKEQNSIYQAEENRKFIEKKKSEREAAEKKLKEEAEAKAKREAELAPDKEKLQKILNELILSIPSLGSKESVTVYELISDRFSGFKKWANDQISALK